MADDKTKEHEMTDEDETKEREMADEIDWTDKERWGPCHSGVGRGWYPAVLAAERALRELVPGVQIQQVKEKWGGLRLYYRTPEGTPGESAHLAYLATEVAEERCWAACEKCGAPGRVRDDRGWRLTLCDEHQRSVPGAGKGGRRGPEAGPPAAFSRRLAVVRKLREACEAARVLADLCPDELAECGLAAADVEALEGWWRAALASLGALGAAE